MSSPPILLGHSRQQWTRSGVVQGMGIFREDKVQGKRRRREEGKHNRKEISPSFSEMMMARHLG